MESELLPDFSMAGFVDYNDFYSQSGAGWFVVAVLIFLGAYIAGIPQISLIASKMSSFGLNFYTIINTSIGQVFIVVNLFCLHAPDFIGITQASSAKPVISTLMTFLNSFSLWIIYLPITYLSYIFFDTNERVSRPQKTRDYERKLCIVSIVLVTSLSICFMIVFTVLAFTGGVGCVAMVRYGQTLGTLANIITFIQCVPQIVTTFKLKDKGSLSIITLAIMAPGGFANTFYMWFGAHNSWTTWSSYFLAATQQTILLVMSIYYDCRKKRQARILSESPMLSEVSMK